MPLFILLDQTQPVVPLGPPLAVGPNAPQQNFTTLAEIAFADWSLALDTPGFPGSGIGSVMQGVADVNQCIAIILSTPPGADPLRPTFGADLWRYLDYPINAAIPHIVRTVTEAVEAWEPRVKLLSVTVTPVVNTPTDPNSNAHLNINVTWQLDLGGTPSPSQVTTVTL